jgi:photosystem II stability/assembly factor-like uncharacterized protein
LPLPAAAPPRTAKSSAQAATQTITQSTTKTDKSLQALSVPAGTVAETVEAKTLESQNREAADKQAKTQAWLTARLASPAPNSPTVATHARAAHGGPFSSAISNGQNAYNQNSLAQQQAAQAQQNAAAMNVPQASETVEVANQSSLAPTETAQDVTAQLQARTQPAPLPGTPRDSLSDKSPGLVRAKPAMKAEFGPQWVVTATGSLQRSFDQGNSWQDVNVSENLSLPANGRSTTELAALAPSRSSASVSSAPVSKDSQQELTKQSSAQKGARKKSTPAAPPVFRTVVANGGDVWAGGSNAALYHSVDAGNHWTQVVPVAAGASLTGDVLRIEFTDAQHGKVDTSTSETWLTADSGQTWQKQ